MNSVNIVGRLVRDPETSMTGGGKKVVHVSIAVSHSKDDSSFFDVVAWEKQAELLSKLHKGEQVGISGYLKQDRWEDKQTVQKRSKVVLNCLQVTFVGGNGQKVSNQPMDEASDFQPAEVPF